MNHMIDSLSKYQRSWPILYHVTPAANLRRLKATKQLDSVAVLLSGSEHKADILSGRRMVDRMICVGSYEATIRSQAPLHEANLELLGGWSFADYLNELNARVFFWPGTGEGPNPYGRRHILSRVNVVSALLRVNLRDLLSANAGSTLCVSRFNTGAPRRYNGRPSPRGPETFIAVGAWTYSPSRVAEVSFVGSVRLPDSTEVQAKELAGWNPLFESLGA